jgi:hypothetical protein
MGDSSKSFFDAEAKRLTREEYARRFLVYLPKAKEIVAAHYSGLDDAEKAQLEVSIAGVLSSNEAVGDLFLLVNNWSLSIAEGLKK